MFSKKMKKYNEILKEKYSDRILAHTSKGKHPESLIEHSRNTLEYFNVLMGQLGIEKVLNKIILELLPEEALSIVREMVESIVYYHDFGKINPLFQKDKMNKDIDIDCENLDIDTTHSFYGKLLFDACFYDYFFDKISKSNLENSGKHKALSLLFILSLTIDRHHTSLNDVNDIFKKIEEDKNLFSQEQGIVKSLNRISDHFLKKPTPYLNPDFLLEEYNFRKKKNIRFKTSKEREALFYLYKLTYSLLITSDYYATMEYMQGYSYKDKIKYIDANLKNKVNSEFYKVKKIGKNVYNYNSRLEKEDEIKNLLEKSINSILNLNDLRTRILVEADDNLRESLRKNPDQKVFYLKVPTGGGKTNTSLKLALTLLNERDEIRKIFYVFPYINIIEQNYNVIKDILNLKYEISPIYSTSSWNLESESKEEQLNHVLDNDFLNFPFVVMSNVNFFNTFIKAGKSSNYRLLNLANSTVILDEIQSLDDNDWTAFNNFIKYSSKFLNIHYIIMSATLPRLDKLSQEDSKSYVDLIGKPEDYYKHKCFNSRVEFEYKNETEQIEQIPGLISREIQDSNPKKILVVLNTIEDSIDTFERLRNDFKLDYELFLLNSTILPYRRKEIISKINESNDKIILVSTQSVEAGIDIDCDLGIRDLAIFDSIEQVAGRINRNFKRDSAKLIIINLKKNEKSRANVVYRGSYRWNIVRAKYLERINEFVKSRDFNNYYSDVLNSINFRDANKIIETSIDIVEKGVRSLNFRKLNEMKVIDTDSISFFTDAKVPIENFSESELRFLDNLGVRTKNYLNGNEVWEVYQEFNKNFREGFVTMKVNTKIWSSIISQFIINVFDYWVEGQKLSEKLGLIEKKTYLKGYNHITGLNPKEISEQLDFNNII